jgi:hypothetical protein
MAAAWWQGAPLDIGRPASDAVQMLFIAGALVVAVFIWAIANGNSG